MYVALLIDAFSIFVAGDYQGIESYWQQPQVSWQVVKGYSVIHCGLLINVLNN